MILRVWTLQDWTMNDGRNGRRWTMTWISSSRVEQTTEDLFFYCYFKCHLLNKTPPAVANTVQDTSDVDGVYCDDFNAPCPAAAAADEPADCCEVCLVAPREGFALEPCGHARFCDNCANRVATLDCCPVCRANISMIMRI